MARWARTRSASLTNELDNDDVLRRLRVLVVGDASAGKSMLMYRLEHGVGESPTPPAPPAPPRPPPPPPMTLVRSLSKPPTRRAAEITAADGGMQRGGG